MTQSLNKISFPGINKSNFWNEITLKQRGSYPWTEDKMKIYYEVTDKQISNNNKWNHKQFETMADFISLHHQTPKPNK
jgi:hypothetical protein